MLVEIRRADGEPLVVDDADLGVDVDTRLLPTWRSHRAEQQSVLPVRGFENTELAARVVVAIVRPSRQHEHEPELVARWSQQLFTKQRHDLSTPEELVLEIDQSLGASHRAQVRLEDAEITVRERWIGLLRDGTNDLR